jgi:hypothetical protein
MRQLKAKRITLDLQIIEQRRSKMKVYFKGWLTVLALALAVLVMIALATQPARAAGPWYVAPGGSDGNTCTSPGAACASINGAIAKASAGDTIYVATGTYTGTGDEVVLLDKNVTLSGGWDAGFTTQSGTSTIDGEGARQGMTVNSGVTAIIERFTIQNGSAWRGGIRNDGTVTLNNCTISGNTGGIGNDGTLTLNNSIVSGNTTGLGGGIRNGGTMTLNNSIVSGNTAGLSGGGIINDGTLTLNNSTVSGNTAKEHGGGIANTWENTLTLNNSTVSGNTANEDGGGIRTWFGTLTLNNSTISGNTARVWGGGVGGGTATLQNTILADNTSLIGPDCSSTIDSLGYNLVGNTSGCNFIPGTDDLTDVSANLGQLIGVSDAPRYHPLLSGSPAIDAGNPAGCTGSTGPLTTDQRGAARVGRCDIGAYEYTTPGPAASISAIGGTPQRTPPSTAFWMPLQAAVLDSIGSPVNNAMVTFSAPASGASGIFSDSGTFTTSAVTNESGFAAAATFTANGLEGSYTVAATVGGVVTPANFLLSNVGWYVATSGNDLNDCQSPTTPCATVNGTLGKAGFTAGDTVLVATGTYTGTVNEVVLLDKSVRLLGGWDGTFTTQSGTSTIDVQESTRGITVMIAATATVERFTVQNGLATQSGGGIYNDGILTLNNSAVINNATTTEFAFKWGGGIYNVGNLTLNNSTVSGNTSPKGGGIYSIGTLTLNSSTVSGNTASMGGGIYRGDGIVYLNNSTVSGNTANTNGGGIENHTTATWTLILQNSIVAGNTSKSSWEGPDCFGGVGSSGYNLIGDTSDCIFTPTAGDLTNIDPKLGLLVGSPGYHHLLQGSPAIDAGNPAGCTDHLGNPLPTDQRGYATTYTAFQRLWGAPAGSGVR